MISRFFLRAGAAARAASGRTGRMQQEYTKRELDCMQLARATTYRGKTLPSLKDECRKRKLDEKGGGQDLRRHFA